MLTLRAAINGGADVIVLCDTNGGTMPSDIEAALKDVQNAFDGHPVRFGIHTHNDCGLAVANAITAVKSGVVMVQVLYKRIRRALRQCGFNFYHSDFVY